MTSLRHSKLSAILVVAPVCIVSLVGRGWGAVVLLVKIHISCAENCNKYFFSCGILMMVLVVSVTWVRTIPVFTNRGRPEFAYELGTVGWSQWEKESMVVLSSWLRLNKAEFHHGLHSIESSWCVIFCLIINCCRPVAEWHDQHFDHSWARHSCGPAPGAQMVSNGKHVGVGSDCYIETVDLPNTFESHEVSITNTRNLYHCLLKLQMPCSR